MLYVIHVAPQNHDEYFPGVLAAVVIGVALGVFLGGVLLMFFLVKSRR